MILMINKLIMNLTQVQDLVALVMIRIQAPMKAHHKYKFKIKKFKFITINKKIFKFI